MIVVEDAEEAKEEETPEVTEESFDEVDPEEDIEF